MNERIPTYRIEIKNNGIAPNKSYGWQARSVSVNFRGQKLYASLNILPAPLPAALGNRGSPVVDKRYYGSS